MLNDIQGIKQVHDTSIKKLEISFNQSILSKVKEAIDKLAEKEGLELDDDYALYTEKGTFDIGFELYLSGKSGNPPVFYTSVETSEKTFIDLMTSLEDDYNLRKDLALDGKNYLRAYICKQLEDIFRSARIWYQAA